MNLKYIYLFSLFIILLGCAQISEEVKEKTIQKLHNPFNDTSKYPGEDLIKFLPIPNEKIFPYEKNFEVIYMYPGISNFSDNIIESVYLKVGSGPTLSIATVFKSTTDELIKKRRLLQENDAISLKIEGFDVRFLQGHNKTMSQMLVDLNNETCIYLSFINNSITPEDALREYLSSPKINITKVYFPEFSEEIKIFLSKIVTKMGEILDCEFQRDRLYISYSKDFFRISSAYCYALIDIPQKKAFYYNAINPFSKSGGRSELIKTEIIL